MTKKLDVRSFAKCFEADFDELFELCGDLINNTNLEYRICKKIEKNEIIASINDKCDSGIFSVSGKDRKSEWLDGWEENLKGFLDSNYNLNALIPKYIKDDRPLRFDGNYIISKTNYFEQKFSTIFRKWLFTKYFNSINNIYEFGCGTGIHLALLARLFKNKKYFGLDWVESSQKILSLISKHYGWDITGHKFDFFNPDYNFDILPNSGIFTFGALEQIGNNYVKFIDYILQKKPKLCVNIECFNELYDENNEFDLVALKYHKQRNYLNGYLDYLKQLQDKSVINIKKIKRLNFGSQYHEVYSYVIWEIV